MTTSHDRGSAKIYTFPARGRFAIDGGRDDSKAAANPALRPAARVVFGGGWYHEEAIRDTEPARKN